MTSTDTLLLILIQMIAIELKAKGIQTEQVKHLENYALRVATKNSTELEKLLDWNTKRKGT